MASRTSAEPAEAAWASRPASVRARETTRRSCGLGVLVTRPRWTRASTRRLGLPVSVQPHWEIRYFAELRKVWPSARCLSIGMKLIGMKLVSQHPSLFRCCQFK